MSGRGRSAASRSVECGSPPGRREEARLSERFRLLARGAEGLQRGDRVVVALSGGLDSVVLLHLLRFGGAPEGVELHAAHFDHRMRRGSAADALWVGGLCRAWGVVLYVGRADAVPTSEDEAREARYGFLDGVRVRTRARHVLTAHHADDQAETVLFRALRGTGQAGLAGIPGRREPGLWRPLLGFWREELEEYARRMRLRWRDDPTNTDGRFARNALRGRILPDIERLVAPGARKALVRLADIAREDEAGWESLLPALVTPLDVRTAERSVSFDHAALSELHPAVQARVIRSLSQELGLRLDGSATGLAIDFAASATSGRGVELTGGWRLERQLDRLLLRQVAPVPPDRPLCIPDSGPGSGEVLLAGQRFRVAWGHGAHLSGRRGAVRAMERFDPGALRFPLMVRAREPGDRIRLSVGTKKVKKLFLERRILPVERERIPLVVDAEGEVLWIPEVARTEPRPGHASRGGLTIGIA